MSKELKKIKKVNKIMSYLKKVDDGLYELLSESTYDKRVSHVVGLVEDMALLALVGKDYDGLDEKFTSPGCYHNEKDKIILWDYENSGYPVENLLDLLKFEGNEKKILEQVKLIKEGLKKKKNTKEDLKRVKKLKP